MIMAAEVFEETSSSFGLQERVTEVVRARFKNNRTEKNRSGCICELPVSYISALCGAST
jgi:hypothetical protein